MRPSRGSFYGCPSVGLSLDDHRGDADFDAAAAYGKRIVGDILAAKIELPLCLNVNVPVGRPETIKGDKTLPPEPRLLARVLPPRRPRGREYFWLTGEFVNGEPGAGTPGWALANNYVAVVPVQTDLTDYRQLSSLRNVLEVTEAVFFEKFVGTSGHRSILIYNS